MVSIEIKEIEIFTEWKWNVHNEECAICRCEIEDPSKESIGICKHVYHTECINMWIKKKNTCPLCNINWKKKN